MDVAYFDYFVQIENYLTKRSLTNSYLLYLLEAYYINLPSNGFNMVSCFDSVTEVLRYLLIFFFFEILQYLPIFFCDIAVFRTPKVPGPSYCVARKKPIKGEKTKPQTAAAISCGFEVSCVA